MEILGSVAAKVVELTVGPIVRQVGYLLCYRNNFKELKNQAKELHAKKERIDREVEVETRNGREIESDVRTWQESVIKTLVEAKQLYEYASDVNAGCSKWSFHNLKSRHQRSRKAMKMASVIVEMKGKGNFDKGVGYIPRFNIINNLPATRASDELESRNSVKEEIMLSLKDPKVSKIGVYGIGGVGKTTLVKEVAKQVKEDKLFDEVVIVTISQTSLEKIQDEIAEQLGLHLEEKTSSVGRAYYLCERIKKEKTILIILDDLREKIDLDKLGIPSLDTWRKIDSEKVGVPLKDDCKGCKLLLTSRGQDILQQNDTQKNFSLQVLNVEESWSLFEAMVGDVVKDDDFRKIATQVAQRCVGLPVLIVTIAKSLKYNNNIYYWKDTLNNLKGVDNKDMHDTLFSALEFNFNRLEDEVNKVFLLCGVHGTSIFFSDLLKYAVGLGIFKRTNAIEDARIRLHRIIDDLKKSCLLVDDDAKTEVAKMHDIVHEVAILIASKYAFSKINAKWQDWERNDIPERCTQIILERCFIKKLPERLDCPHLTFLHINSTDNHSLEIPDSFFEGAGNLEALDLTGMIISSLPISFSLLTKLITLCLDYCSLNDMSRIGVLLNLEILSLIGSSIQRFPSEIEQLTKLRMLDLSKSVIGTTLPNIWCKLTKIEELYMGDASINWEVESSTKQKRNASLASHLTGLTTLELQVREAWLLPKDIPFDKLERYKVVIGEKWEWLGNEGTSRLLKVKLDTNIRWERGIKTLIESVEDLYLDKIIGISNVLFELNGKGFPLLKHLHVQNNGEIQHIINSVERNQTHVLFPRLETLLLHNLNNLVKICHGPIRENSFCKLKVLKVKNCDQLVYLFSVSMVKACSQIVEIQVSECNSMKRIVSIESADRGNSIDEQIEFRPLQSLTLQHLPTIDEFCSHESRANVPTPFFSTKVKFYNLETLKLSSVNLKNIWDVNQSSAPYLIQNLANLTVEDCSGLKYLFSSSIVGRLSNLKQLEISKCHMMEEIIATEEISGASSGELILQLLFTLEELKVAECDSLERVFDVKALDDKEIKSKEVSQLKKLTLSRLPNLKSIWNGEAGEIINYENLQTVEVDKCQHLKNLFSVSLCQDLRQLEVLHIESCGVEEIVQVEEGLEELKFDFPQLTILNLFNLTRLTNFYPKRYTLECPSLKQLNVRGCEELQLFAFDPLNAKPLGEGDNDLNSIALFHIEKVPQKLKELPLNEKDAMMILNGKYEKNPFGSIKRLRLQQFQETPIKFLNNLIQIFPAITTIQVRCSSFEALFPSEEIGHCNIESPTQIKTLWLFQLQKLERIWNDDTASHALVQDLEHMYISECPSLIRLAPPSASFKTLTYLEVKDCNGLMCFMTTYTTKSLVHLTALRLTNCGMLEEVVMTDEGESEEEIAFGSLKYLELNCLSSFKSFCSGKHTFIFPSLIILRVIGCHKMQNFSSGVINAPFLKFVEVENGKKRWIGDLNTTIKQLFMEKAIEEGVEGGYRESVNINKQSSHIHQNSASTSRALSSKERAHGVKSEADETVYNSAPESSPSQAPEAVASSNQDEEEPQDSNILLTVGTQETYKSKGRFSVRDAQNILSPTMVHDRGMDEATEKSLIQTTQEAQSPATIHDIEESQDSEACPRDNSCNQSTTFVIGDKKQITGTQELHDTIQTKQNTESLATTQNTEESHDSSIGTQGICDTVILNSTMIHDAAIDPSPSKAPEPAMTSVLESDACSAYKWLIDISKQNLPHLEAGLKRHPQVLDWFNTKRRRIVFATLFTEVTRILRTTRLRDLTKDDRNYITECCTALEAVGFDASWLSYVNKCIESCGDGDELKRKLEETEVKASTLRNELASVEASLALLRDEASRLDNFIES